VVITILRMFIVDSITSDTASTGGAGRRSNVLDTICNL
jgi:hypothetical protein